MEIITSILEYSVKQYEINLNDYEINISELLEEIDIAELLENAKKDKANYDEYGNRIAMDADSFY